LIILDTTVLIYAVGEAHPLRESCISILSAHRDGTIDAVTTVEVIREFTHVYARRRDRAAAMTLAFHYADALPLLETTATDLRRGLGLFVRHPELGAFDAVLVAVALSRDEAMLISADRAFGVVPGLRWIDPASADLSTLLRPTSP